MPSPLTRKLQLGVRFDDADEAEVEKLSTATSTVRSREPLITEGDRCGSLYVLTSGWACRFKTQSGLSRQIIGFLVPGDHVAVDPMQSREMDYGVCTLTTCEFAETPLTDLEAIVQDRPRVGQALRWAALLDEAILREWLLGLGRRPAEKRMGHLFCELLVRLQGVGLAEAATYALPLSQAALGEALGLSPAHVNRSLQSLRARQLLTFERGVLTVPSVERLQKFAGFNPHYLHPTSDARPPAT